MNARSTVLALITLLALHVQSGLAWGNLGHQTIGYFLAPNALSFVQTTLGSQYNFSLGPAATWADMVKSEPAFTWSKNLHFVDAEDDPPSSCSVEEIRDCADQICVLAAIANYTTRVVDPTLDAEQIQEALKFIDHFVGDIGQPLHVEAVAAGGNDIDATCSGSKTNLHAVHTGMLTKNVDAVHGGTSEQYAADLVAEIQTGAFSSLTADWLSCTSTTEPVNNKREDATPSIERDVRALLATRDTAMVTPLECPLGWARESNAFDCSTVFNFEPEEDPELCEGTYFTNAIPVIDLQLAKQGFRLAAWLNVIFDGAPMLS
ncbi:uncharacterized protein PHACADRAFT_155682 [Phanerochaete carnosa HHB-10118-sp]|uniref:Nuclease Le1 n=1 Tax=Phanerochaete carnosa (strain HHB-10118-sp) TaxID=650164 RepID=K5WMW1_PHACS|nr:uncharacterized protein PHACADRAFT_155682 [Phanerochaete carnosa HHB-10118-sp]EKM60554.1 hypothetical protein PHACADRAFT_155682 [Phanerochaete carnosa HHB-10118-sp]